jgi:hypothetical protein
VTNPKQLQSELSLRLAIAADDLLESHQLKPDAKEVTELIEALAQWKRHCHPEEFRSLKSLRSLRRTAIKYQKGQKRGRPA